MGTDLDREAATDLKAELEALDEEELDELVHDKKGKEAANINNAGKEAQLRYLLYGKEGKCSHSVVIDTDPPYCGTCGECLEGKSQ
jgi:hypothetical protein